MKRSRTILLLGLVPPTLVVAASDCYAPTEAVLTLTSDPVECGQTRVAIYKGAPGAIESTAQAETNHCATANGLTTIGDLVFVPSADKEGRMSVRATMALGGKPTTACAAEPANCIVATRTFAFVEHASRSIPVRFVHDCIGAVCPNGSTCTTGRICVSDECIDDQCHLSNKPIADASLPPAPVGVPNVVPDGGPTPEGDASTDGPAPDLECTAADGTNVLATAANVPSAASESPGEIYWGDQLGAGSSPILQRTIKDSGVTDAAYRGYSVGDTIQAVGYLNDFLVAGGAGTGTALIKTGGDSGSVFFSPAGTKVVSAIVGQPTRFVISTDDGKIYERPAVLSAFKVVHDHAAAEIIARQDDYFAATSTGVVRIVAGQSATTGSDVAGSPANARLAKRGDTVYAMGEDGTAWSLWQIDPGFQKLVQSLEPATSISVDATHVYFIDTNAVLRRAPLAGGASAQLVAATGVNLAHVAVDDRCLYFWSKHAGERATLRSIPKKPLATLAAGPAE